MAFRMYLNRHVVPGSSLPRERGGHNPGGAGRARPRALAGGGGQAPRETALQDRVRLQYRQHT